MTGLSPREAKRRRIVRARLHKIARCKGVSYGKLLSLLGRQNITTARLEALADRLSVSAPLPPPPEGAQA